MSAINVNSITGRTGLHGPVLTGVSTAADGFQILSGEFKVNGISTFVGMSTFNGGISVASGLHADDDMYFHINDAERLRITSNGTLLVGLTTAVGEGGTPADLNSTEVGRGFINLSRDDTVAADHILFGKNGSIAASMGTDTTNTLVFKTGTTEAMRIDSSGKVGINISNLSSYNSVGNDLVLGNTGNHGGLTIVSGTANNGHILFADGTASGDQNRGVIKYIHGTTNAMAFYTNDIEAMRIDSSGRLLVGTDTSPTAWNGLGAKIVIQGYPNTPQGGGHISLQRGEAAVDFVADDQIGLINFGDNTGASFAVIECYSDAASGANDYPGRLVFKTTADGASTTTERMRIDSSGKIILPTSSPGIQFGSTDSGGDISSQTLDDYEEGTWTPALKFGGANTGLAASYTGNYTKIGNTVHYYFRANLTNKGSSTGAATIEGLPFTCGPYYCVTVARIYSANSLSGPIMPRTQYNGSYITLVEQNASGDSNLTDAHFNATSQLIIMGTYFI